MNEFGLIDHVIVGRILGNEPLCFDVTYQGEAAIQPGDKLRVVVKADPFNHHLPLGCNVVPAPLPNDATVVSRKDDRSGREQNRTGVEQHYNSSLSSSGTIADPAIFVRCLDAYKAAQHSDPGSFSDEVFVARILAVIRAERFAPSTNEAAA